MASSSMLAIADAGIAEQSAHARFPLPWALHKKSILHKKAGILHEKTIFKFN